MQVPPPFATYRFQDMDAKQFIDRVVPVPAGGFIGITQSRPNLQAPHRPFWSNRGYQTSQDAVSYAVWADGMGFTTYVALASYKTATVETNKAGRPYFKIERTNENALSRRALALDIDLDLPGKARNYPDLTTAAQEVNRLIYGQLKLPPATLLVDSGWGLHVYWLLDADLDTATFTPLAQRFVAAVEGTGLKADLGVSKDMARVLRIPGSTNRKVDGQPRTVNVLYAAPANVSYAAFQQALQAFTPAVTAPIALPAMMQAGGGQVIAFPTSAGVNAALAANMQLPNRPATMQGVISACAVFGEMAQTHGAASGDYNVWRSLVAVMAHTEDGDKFVHPLSDGYTSPSGNYDPAKTTDLWNDTIKRRDAGKLGPGLCATIRQERRQLGLPDLCAVCPHLGKIKTPKQLGEVPEPDMPPGYRSGQNGTERQFTADDGTTIWRPILQQVNFHDFKLFDGDKGFVLEFSFTRSGGRTARRRIVTQDMPVAGRDGAGRLIQFFQGLSLNVPDQDGIHVRKFLMAWVTHLDQQANQAKDMPAFGWYLDNGQKKGFAVAGRMFHGDGRIEDVMVEDRSTTVDYKSTGTAAPWDRAFAIVATAQRPDLAILVATSFGAPLLEFLDQDGLIMSFYSPGTGTGKTTALRLAQAVWGNPKGTNHLDDTSNSASRRLAVLRHLPAYWDELKARTDIENFARFAFRVTQGTEKRRMRQDSSLMGSQSWRTMMSVATNDSLADLLSGSTTSTDAGFYRVLEVPVDGPRDPAQAHALATAMADLRSNHGVHGRTYAKWLATHPDRVRQVVDDCSHQWAQHMGFSSSERFWRDSVAAICAGAILAQEAGIATFPLAAMAQRLAQIINVSRGQIHHVANGAVDRVRVLSVLSRYLNDVGRYALYTDDFQKPGKPSATTPPKVLAAPSSDVEPLAYHVAIQAGRIRLRHVRFQDWLYQKKLNGAEVLRGIRELLGGKRYTAPLGGGTMYAQASESVMDIDFSNQPDVADAIPAKVVATPAPTLGSSSATVP